MLIVISWNVMESSWYTHAFDKLHKTKQVPVNAVKSVYLLIKAMLLLNDKCAVQTPRKPSQGTEQGGEHQKYEWLGYLVLWTKSKTRCHRASNTPQKWDPTQEQDQLKDFKQKVSFTDQIKYVALK